MSKTRNPVIPEDVAKRLLLKCMVCQTPVEGFYARFGDQGTCSKTCMGVIDKKPKYPGHTEEDYFRRLGETFDENSSILDQGE